MPPHLCLNLPTKGPEKGGLLPSKWPGPYTSTFLSWLGVSVFYFLACVTIIWHEWRNEWTETGNLMNKEAPFLIRLWIPETIIKSFNVQVISCAPPPHQPPLCTTPYAIFLYSMGKSKRSASIFLIASCCPRTFTLQARWLSLKLFSIHFLSQHSWCHRHISVMQQACFTGT